MTLMNVDLECQPDYYRNTYTLDTYTTVLKRVCTISPHTTLCLSEDGVDTTNKVHAAWSSVKGLFGCDNPVQEVRITYELMKFLFYGLTHQYTDTAEIQRVLKEASTGGRSTHISRCVLDIFAHLTQETYSNTKEESILHIRQELEQFFQLHKKELYPSFVFEKVVVSYNAVFGDTHLALAEQTMNIATTKKILLHYCNAAQLHNSQEVSFSERLYRSFSQFSRTIQNPDVTTAELLAKNYELLAKRYYAIRCFSEAGACLQEADFYQTVQSSELLSLWFRSCKQQKNHLLLKRVIDRLSPQNINPQFKDEYHNGCIEVGDYFFNRASTLQTIFCYNATFRALSSPANFYKQALRYYELSLKVLDNDSTFYTPLQRILKVAKHLLKEQGLSQRYYQQGLEFMKQARWEVAIYHFFIAMQLMSKKCLLASRKGQYCIENSTLCIQQLSVNPGAMKRCIELIDEALSYIGDVKALFTIEHKSMFKKTPDRIVPHIPDMLLNNAYTYDVGAALHFLKAELLNQAEIKEYETILEEYRLAVDLAPKNPFGIDALFMEDLQASKQDDLSEMIRIYRNLALEWGCSPGFYSHKVY